MLAQVYTLWSTVAFLGSVVVIAEASFDVEEGLWAWNSLHHAILA